MEETKVLLGEIETGQYDERLKAIYVDETMVPYQKERFQKGICKFEELYGAGEVEVYSAPGRSEVGGNHTDHQHGEVLAASINLDAIAVVRKMQNNVIELLSEGYEKICVDLSDLEKKRKKRGPLLELFVE